MLGFPRTPPAQGGQPQNKRYPRCESAPELSTTALRAVQMEKVSPLDTIFSCSICHETLSEVYANPDNNQGLHHGQDPSNRTITKLWLTECAHVTCGKHLQGGGAPFHPEGQPPRAPCPFCSSEKGDDNDRALYWIHGLCDGEFDENIPKAYFQMPPKELLRIDPPNEALRFQYLSLVRFSLKAHEQKETLKNELAIWKLRKPEIAQCMNQFISMQSELSNARQRLVSLGQDVSSIDGLLQHAGASQVEASERNEQAHGSGSGSGSGSDSDSDIDVTTTSVSNLTRAIRLAQSGAADQEALGHISPGTGASRIPQLSHHVAGYSNGTSSSPTSKRRRVQPRDVQEFRDRSPEIMTRPSPGTQSRGMMPPPALPRPNRRSRSTSATTLTEEQFPVGGYASSATQTMDVSMQRPLSVSYSHHIQLPFGESYERSSSGRHPYVATTPDITPHFNTSHPHSPATLVASFPGYVPHSPATLVEIFPGYVGYDIDAWPQMSQGHRSENDFTYPRAAETYQGGSSFNLEDVILLNSPVAAPILASAPILHPATSEGRIDTQPDDMENHVRRNSTRFADGELNHQPSTPRMRAQYTGSDSSIAPGHLSFSRTPLMTDVPQQRLAVGMLHNIRTSQPVVPSTAAPQAHRVQLGSTPLNRVASGYFSNRPDSSPARPLQQRPSHDSGTILSQYGARPLPNFEIGPPESPGENLPVAASPHFHNPTSTLIAASRPTRPSYQTGPYSRNPTHTTAVVSQLTRSSLQHGSHFRNPANRLITAPQLAPPTRQVWTDLQGSGENRLPSSEFDIPWPHFAQTPVAQGAAPRELHALPLSLVGRIPSPEGPRYVSPSDSVPRTAGQHDAEASRTETVDNPEESGNADMSDPERSRDPPNSTDPYANRSLSGSRRAARR